MNKFVLRVAIVSIPPQEYYINNGYVAIGGIGNGFHDNIGSCKKLEHFKKKGFRFIFTSPTFITEKAEKQKREFYIPRFNREQTVPEKVGNITAALNDFAVANNLPFKV